MSKKRLPSSQRKPRGTGVKSPKQKPVRAGTVKKSSSKSAVLFEQGASGSRLAQKGMPSLIFMGVCMAGAKTDKTCLAVVEYFPEQNKIFLSRLFEKIKTENESSADLQLHNLIVGHDSIKSVAFDVPLSLPKCVLCKFTCPGFEACKEPEIEWMWDFYRKKKSKKKPAKLFSPYTERCAELYISENLEESFHPSHALGANLAPLVARALFIKRRLNIPAIEVNPKISLWRIGRSLNIPKSYLRFHRHSVEGESSRKYILERLIEKDIAFLYAQDVRAMTENNQAFDAFMCAITAVLEYKHQTEPRPKNFPVNEPWTSLPLEKIKW